MFTPPPSPMVPHFELEVEEEVPIYTQKSARGRRYRWFVLLVPVALVLITTSTRHLFGHSLSLDSDISLSPVVVPDSDPWIPSTGWSRAHHPHKRHPSPQTFSPSDPISSPTSSESSTSSSGDTTFPTTGSVVFPTSPIPTPTSSASTSSVPAPEQPLPTVPATPPTLPNPFPQPLDSLSQNFSTEGCEDFFLNMTQSTAFRECRPFSLLLQSSSSFISAQRNISELNDVIWGTCNTDLTLAQCDENMAWFAETLQSVCRIDLQANNEQAASTLTGLLAFPVLRSAGCDIDQNTNSYCYASAVHSSNPSDLYFYQIPLGILLPNSTTPSCSACTKTIMNTFAGNSWNLTALGKTYNEAASVADEKCGQGYVATVASSGASLNNRVSLLTVVLAGTFGIAGGALFLL